MVTARPFQLSRSLWELMNITNADCIYSMYLLYVRDLCLDASHRFSERSELDILLEILEQILSNHISNTHTHTPNTQASPLLDSPSLSPFMHFAVPFRHYCALSHLFLSFSESAELVSHDRVCCVFESVFHYQLTEETHPLSLWPSFLLLEPFSRLG